MPSAARLPRPTEADARVATAPQASDDASAGRSAGASAAPGTTWPHQLSHEPLLKVSDVLRILGGEFPALTPSKLRFFDAQGLVSPQRTASGYRQYSASDVERLRFVLREQRDFFRPLAKIQESLAQLDAGVIKRAITPRDAEHETAAFVPAKTLAALASAEPSLVDELIAEGVIVAAVPGGYDKRLATLVSAIDAYIAAGGTLKEAKVLRNAALREAERAGAAGKLAAGRNEPEAAAAHARERKVAAAQLFSAVLEGE